jgi:nitrate/nitrite transporter NarK
MEINLTPEQVKILSIAAYWVGSLARILWPYLLKRIEEGTKFDWRYVTGQAVTSIGVFILALVSQDFVEHLGSLGIVGGLLAGFAAASVGRNGQKTVDVARSK